MLLGTYKTYLLSLLSFKHTHFIRTSLVDYNKPHPFLFAPLLSTTSNQPIFLRPSDFVTCGSGFPPMSTFIVHV